MAESKPSGNMHIVDILDHPLKINLQPKSVGAETSDPAKPYLGHRVHEEPMETKLDIKHARDELANRLLRGIRIVDLKKTA